MRRNLIVSVFGLALLLMLSAPQLRADGGGSDNFTFTEQIAPSENLSVVWNLPASPNPDTFVPGVGFADVNVPTTYFLNGVYQQTTADTFLFLSNAAGGGFIDGFTFGLAGTTQLYTGCESNPTFATGTYNGFDALNFNSNGGFIPATLTIAAPEPSALVLLLFGFLALFGTLTLKKLQA
jgi:hypothetical protein